MNQITDCEVCGNKELPTVLNLGLHPMCDDLVPIGNKRVCKEYPIEILYCEKCFTAHQKFQIPSEELFPQSYHYRSRHTADVLDGMKALVTSYQKEIRPLKGLKVLDIGCNDGSLLDFFRESGAKTFGLEPTGAVHDAINKKHVVMHEYLTPDSANKFVEIHGNPDIITFTNVFAHIEDLNSLIQSIEILRSEHTDIVIENHYLGAVIENNQFDTFYHEHPRTYSLKSFLIIAERLRMQIGHVEFPKRYGGNVRVIFSSQKNFKNNHHIILAKEQAYFDGLQKMALRIDSWQKRKKEEITNAIAKHGTIIAKAFPGRSAITMKLLGLDVQHIKAVYEKPESNKIGYYVPGTRIPILSDEHLLDDWKAPAPLLNLAWHIKDEIHHYMRNTGFTGDFIEILD